MHGIRVTKQRFPLVSLKIKQFPGIGYVGCSECNTDYVEPDNLRILRSLSITEASLQKYKIVSNFKQNE